MHINTLVQIIKYNKFSYSFFFLNSVIHELFLYFRKAKYSESILFFKLCAYVSMCIQILKTQIRFINNKKDGQEREI